MKQFAGTPGEWVLGDFDDYGGYDCMFAGVMAGPARIWGSSYGQEACFDLPDGAESRMMADARLISAAPALLEALQAVVAFWDSITMEDQVNGIHVQARAAVAKALGE